MINNTDVWPVTKDTNGVANSFYHHVIRVHCNYCGRGFLVEFHTPVPMPEVGNRINFASCAVCMGHPNDEFMKHNPALGKDVVEWLAREKRKVLDGRLV